MELPGGGWPRAGAHGDPARRRGPGRGLAPAAGALKAVAQEGRAVAWINPPHLPYAPALALGRRAARRLPGGPPRHGRGCALVSRPGASLGRVRGGSFLAAREDRLRLASPPAGGGGGRPHARRALSPHLGPGARHARAPARRRHAPGRAAASLPPQAPGPPLPPPRWPFRSRTCALAASDLTGQGPPCSGSRSRCPHCPCSSWSARAPSPCRSWWAKAPRSARWWPAPTRPRVPPACAKAWRSRRPRPWPATCGASIATRPPNARPSSAWRAGRRSSRPRSAVEPTGLVLEVEGSVKLFGGLAKLLAALRGGVRALGLQATVGVAPTPLAARAFARAEARGMAVRSCATMADLPARLAELPLFLLEWPGRTLEHLSDLGVVRVKDALALPRGGLLAALRSRGARRPRSPGRPRARSAAALRAAGALPRPAGAAGRGRRRRGDPLSPEAPARGDGGLPARPRRGRAGTRPRPRARPPQPDAPRAFLRLAGARGGVHPRHRPREARRAWNSPRPRWACASRPSGCSPSRRARARGCRAARSAPWAARASSSASAARLGPGAGLRHRARGGPPPRARLEEPAGRLVASALRRRRAPRVAPQRPQKAGGGRGGPVPAGLAPAPRRARSASRRAGGTASP